MFSSGKLLASSPSDPYFNYNTLLLKEVGTNGQQNNTFVDGSVNNFTITRNGNSTQGTFAPFVNSWSNFFNASSWLTFPASSAYQFGTGDFTIEWWHYQIGTVLYPRVFSIGTYPTAAIAVSIESGSLYFWELTIPAKAIIALTNHQNIWTHFAISRVSNVTRIFRDGVQIGTNLTDNNNINDATNTLRIGAESTSSVNTNFNGYISNFRIVKGTGLYTGTFTPSTTPLTAISGTSLLTCQSNRFVDNSLNNSTATANTGSQVSRSAPFLGTAYSTSSDGGSGYFDGNGDFLQTPTDTALNFNSVDYTVEGWAYLDMATYSSFDLGGRGIVSDYLTNSSARWAVLINSSGRLEFAEQNASGAATVSVADSSAIVLKQWFHFAAVKSGTTMYLFKNGVSVGTNSSAVRTTFGGRINVGQFTIDASYRAYFLGYISNIRLVKGSALYTSNFTPSTTPLTAVSNTSLLLNFTNSGIYDVTENNTLETVSSAQANTTQSKWGGSSIYFAGAGNYLVPNADSSLNAFGSGNFTIEFWVYLNATQTSIFYDGRPVSGIGTTPTIYVTNNALFYFTNNANRITGGTLSNTTWTHIAVSRSGTSTRMFINGTQTGATYTDSVVYTNTTSRPIIGGDGNNLSSTSFLNGYIEDLRVTKGIARYTANFTAPTAPFPTR